MSDDQAAPLLDSAHRTPSPEVRTFETLDGLRGVAALTVVIWHSPLRRWIPSAYLAVDLFFILSGFVLAYRYQNRLGSDISARRFMMMRVIRLYPLYLLGSAVGAAWQLAKILHYSPDRAHLTNWLVNAGFGLLVFPRMDVPGQSVFPFNAPAWSLFYELVVNLIFGFVIRTLSDFALIACIVVSAALLVIASILHGNLHFTIIMPYFLVGSVRAIFGFSLGILLFRLRAAGKLPAWRLHPASILALLLVALMVPRNGVIASLLAPAIVIVAFPLLVTLGVSNDPSGRLARWMTWAGILSFPLYAIHSPLLHVLLKIATRLAVPVLVAIPMAIGLVLVLAWLAHHVYDVPVRRWLTNRVKRRRLDLSAAAGERAK